MKRYFAFALILLTILATFSVPGTSTAPVYANSSDQCNQVFTYEKTSDFNDARVTIDFRSNDTRIDVSADAGYSIQGIWLDVDDDGQSGYVSYGASTMTNFNPSGDEINRVKVQVKKVCTTPTHTLTPTGTGSVCAGGDNAWSGDWYKDQTNPFSISAPSGYTIDQICVKGGQDIITFSSNTNNSCWSVSGIGTQNASATKIGSGSSCHDISHVGFHRIVVTTPTVTATNTPTPTITATPTVSVTPSVTITATPTDTPTPTPTIDPNNQGNGNSTTPTASPSATVTPSLTATPTPTSSTSTTSTSSTSGGDGRSDGRSDGQSSTPLRTVESIQVTLGETKMASTGTFANSLMNAMFGIGSLTTALGILSYKKQK